MNNFDHLLKLPGPPDALEWLKDRLETLSVREGYVLTAALMRSPPQDLEEAVSCLHSLDRYEICFPSESYEVLGEFSLRKNRRFPEDALPYIDLDRVGQQYKDGHPGLFVGDCYVAYPQRPAASAQQENELPLLWDGDWSVKLRLASPAVPKGVWLRLPGRDGKPVEKSDEVVLALHELKAESLEDCTLLEARCIFPEAGDLMKQYSSITELVRDGDNLGYIMDEHGQGNPYWREKFAAALEYEDCRTLKFALDISQNRPEASEARRSISESLAGRGQEGLRQLQAAMEYEDCARLSEAVEIAARLDSYEFMEIDNFQEDAKRELLEKGLDERVIDMCFNLESYAAITHNFADIYSSHNTGLYVHRNNTISQPEQGGMMMQ